MKVLLELLDDAANVLSNLDRIDDLRPESQKRLRKLLERLSSESARLLREVDSADSGDEESTRQERRDAVLERGLAAIARKRLDEAEEILRRGVESFPGDIELLNHLGLACWEKGAFDDAEGWYHRAMEIGLADANRAKGNTCASLSRGYFRAVEGRALCLDQMGESDRAVELFDALGTMRPDDYAGCHYLAGEILHAEGRVGEAIEAYRRSPDEPSVHYNLGLAYFQQGDTERAARTLIRGFAANPHIAAQLLDTKVGRLGGPGGYLGSATYAEEFLEACRGFWMQQPRAIAFLAECYDHELVRDYLERLRHQADEGKQPRERTPSGGDDSSEREVDGIARRVIERIDP